jgi:hypothetical protein
MGVALAECLVVQRALGMTMTVPPQDPDWMPPPHPEVPVGPQPGWYAVSVNKLHDQSRRYAYFERFEPVAMAGYSTWIYHISPEEADRVRRELAPQDSTEGKP